MLALPFQPPLPPMLCKLSGELPPGDGWLFEPKWDGFRALVFKDESQVYLQSRDSKPLGRYFPELEASLKANLPARCVLDGEIVMVSNGRLDFEGLQLRLHPAASRVKKLSEQFPTAYVAWDLLALGDEDLREKPQSERRARLVEALAGAKAPVHVTPASTDRAVATDWFTRFEGAGLDGVIAKPLAGTYLPDKRAMVKVKHQRTAECVVAGFRWYKDAKEKEVGSLVLALYDDAGMLLPVGVASSFSRAFRAELKEKLEPFRANAKDTHPWKEWLDWEQAGGAQHAGNRWNRGKDMSWEPIRLERVAEVAYDHMQGLRFRHATKFVRWREDKAAADCRFAQLEETPPEELGKIFGTAAQVPVTQT